jgi:hypothetical protein
MGLFGSGLSAAMELQERILRALGAEEEWVERGGGEFDFVAQHEVIVPRSACGTRRT